MGNTLSLHRERPRAVCPFVYAVAFGHFLPALPLPSHEDSVFCRRKQQQSWEGREQENTGGQRSKQRPRYITLICVMQNQEYASAVEWIFQLFCTSIFFFGLKLAYQIQRKWKPPSLCKIKQQPITLWTSTNICTNRWSTKLSQPSTGWKNPQIHTAANHFNTSTQLNFTHLSRSRDSFDQVLVQLLTAICQIFALKSSKGLKSQIFHWHGEFIETKTDLCSRMFDFLGTSGRLWWRIYVFASFRWPCEELQLLALLRLPLGLHVHKLWADPHRHMMKLMSCGGYAM